MKLNCSKFEFVFFSCGSVSIVCFFLFLLCSMVSHGNLLSNTDYEYQDLYSNPRVNVIRPQPPPDFDNEFDNDIRSKVPDRNNSSQDRTMKDESWIKRLGGFAKGVLKKEWGKLEFHGDHNQQKNDNPGDRYGQHNQTTCVYLHYSFAWKYLILWEILMIIAGLILICATCVGSRTKRRTISWMLVTMHSNISGYIWLAYYALTYTSCWSSYAPQNGQADWDYFTLSIYGTLRIVVSIVVSIIGAVGNAKFYIPCSKMSPYEVSDFILHLKSLNPKLNVSISTLGSSLTSRYASRISNEEQTGEKEFVPFKWYDYTNAYEDIANIIFPQHVPSNSGVMISINLTVCAHTDDAQSDLNQFLISLSREHGRRITITDTCEYSLSAAIEPTMTGNGRVSRSLRRWSCLCCTCAKIFLRRGFVLKNNNRILIYTTKEETNSFNILASIASTLDMICLSGFATFLWLQLHKNTYRVHIKKAYSSRNGVLDSYANDALIHDFLDDTGLFDMASSQRAQSPPPPPYESAIATGKREDLMKKVKSYFGLTSSSSNNVFSRRASLGQNVCEDVSGLPTYEEAKALRMKSQAGEDDHVSATIT